MVSLEYFLASLVSLPNMISQQFGYTERQHIAAAIFDN